MRLKFLYGNNLYDGYNGNSYTTSYIIEFQYISIDQLSLSCLFSNLFSKELDVVTWQQLKMFFLIIISLGINRQCHE
jgi:hypothetical protein